MQEKWQYKEVMRRLNRIEAKLDALLDGKEVLVRPASLDRLNESPKNASEQWYEETLEEMRYLIAWRKREKEKSPPEGI
jgi:hypothetical protein